MATAGPSVAGTITGTSWSGTGNLAASDDSYATYSLSAFVVSNALVVSNFGFAIPSGATINGISVSIEAKVGSSTGGVDNSHLRKAGVNVGSSKASYPSLSTTEGTQTFGSTSDLWGTTWTDSEINSSGFGYEVAFFNLATTTLSVDTITITVTYTGGGGLSIPVAMQSYRQRRL